MRDIHNNINNNNNNNNNNNSSSSNSNAGLGSQKCTVYTSKTIVMETILVFTVSDVLFVLSVKRRSAKHCPSQHYLLYSTPLSATSSMSDLYYNTCTVHVPHMHLSCTCGNLEPVFTTQVTVLRGRGDQCYVRISPLHATLYVHILPRYTQTTLFARENTTPDQTRPILPTQKNESQAYFSFFFIFL